MGEDARTGSMSTSFTSPFHQPLVIYMALLVTIILIIQARAPSPEALIAGGGGCTLFRFGAGKIPVVGGIARKPACAAGFGTFMKGYQELFGEDTTAVDLLLRGVRDIRATGNVPRHLLLHPSTGSQPTVEAEIQRYIRCTQEPNPPDDCSGVSTTALRSSMEAAVTDVIPGDRPYNVTLQYPPSGERIVLLSAPAEELTYSQGPTFYEGLVAVPGGRPARLAVTVDGISGGVIWTR